MNQNNLENKVADFIVEHSDGIYTASDHSHIAQYAALHMMFGTFFIMRHEGKIIGICRWNEFSPEKFKVLDLVIHPKFRHKQIAREMLLKVKRACPQLKQISFQRKKYAMRMSGIDVERWLKEKSHVRQIVSNNH